MLRDQAVVLIFLLVLSMVSAIYPADHWKYSTELTTDNFDSHVQSVIDSGKTLFVRWIASEGWGWWRKQAPAWNTIAERFASNKDVAFGDINLSKQQIRGNHNPGSGGWPTIKYFNKETGIEGAPYAKKTSKAMCDELGDETYMQAYVEEAGKTSLCSVVDPSNCSDKEKTFIAKMSDASNEEKLNQLRRLDGMSNGSKLTNDAKKWISQRVGILKQLVKATDEL